MNNIFCCTMKVVVEILTGTLFYIQVGNDATIADLKREIGAQQKLPHDRLILFLDNSRSSLIDEIGDATSLVDCGVHDGSHIYLFFNPLDDGSTHHFVFTWPDSFLGFWTQLEARLEVQSSKQFARRRNKIDETWPLTSVTPMSYVMPVTLDPPHLSITAAIGVMNVPRKL
ncbi:uncharacterized protein LOC8270263 [Ricinus communis]|uniref:Ubiquitin-like domain-containing protein n=1 Tax=Ricinus communis TaxID=3988 RepID=B9SMM1_RICCO|nr:uncharacterized protein LOC8270263 [Ricinus communis]EEF35166.1 hypothetical protein RCOM_0231790 [Ricinus communis]|eukprot:XP_002527240.1 uncharacterized protein LOC8270263 [Ricinus communis]